MTNRIDNMTGHTHSKSHSRSIWEIICSSSGTATDRRNQMRFVGWCLAWAITFVAGTWLLKSEYEFSPSARWAIALIPNAIGVMTVLSYMKFLRMADELMQKIQMKGLAFGFGAGVIFALGYQIMEHAGAPQAGINDALLVLTIGWMLGQIIATWRYR